MPFLLVLGFLGMLLVLKSSAPASGGGGSAGATGTSGGGGSDTSGSGTSPATGNQTGPTPPVAGTVLGNTGGGGKLHIANGTGGIYRPAVVGETNRPDSTGTVLTLYPTENTFVNWVKGSDGRWYNAPSLGLDAPATMPDPARGGISGAAPGWNGMGTSLTAGATSTSGTTTSSGGVDTTSTGAGMGGSTISPPLPQPKLVSMPPLDFSGLTASSAAFTTPTPATNGLPTLTSYVPVTTPPTYIPRI